MKKYMAIKVGDTITATVKTVCGDVFETTGKIEWISPLGDVAHINGQRVLILSVRV